MRNSVGIMQGRVIPPRLDKLQVFPTSRWEEELFKIKEIGFDHVEILFDKESVCERLLSNPHYLNSLNNDSPSSTKIPLASSICVDYLSSISAISEKKLFYDVITNVIELVKNTKLKLLVIPFFDKNFVKSHVVFKKILDWFKDCNLDDIAFSNDILLALELTLPAHQIKSALEEHVFKNIKICYDTGNAKNLGYSPEEEIMELDDLVCHIHIKDRKISGSNVTLGEGDVDFKACFNSLKKINYAGLMIIETKYFVSPLQEAEKNLQFVKNILTEI